MKILVFLLLSAIFISETFLGVDSSDGSESSGDFSMYFSDAESSQPAESSTGRSRKGKQPIIEPRLESRKKSSSRNTPDTKAPAVDPAFVQIAKMNMTDLYWDIYYAKRNLNRALERGGNPQEIDNLEEQVKIAEKRIVNHRPTLRKAFGLNAKYAKSKKPGVTLAIEKVKGQLSKNEETLNQLRRQNVPIKTFDKYAIKRNKLEQKLDGLEKALSRYETMINNWEIPEMKMMTELPDGSRYV